MQPDLLPVHNLKHPPAWAVMDKGGFFWIQFQ